MWEYKVVQIGDIFNPGFGKMLGDMLTFRSEEINKILDKYGQENWELINVMPTLGTAGTASKILVFFKRPKR